MNRMKEWLKAFIALPYMKYIVVLVLGFVTIGFVGSNGSVRAHLGYQQRISELREEIDYHESAYARDQERIHQLETDPKAMERIARERYFMKHDDEDIFVLSDDLADTQKTKSANGTDE